MALTIDFRTLWLQSQYSNSVTTSPPMRGDLFYSCLDYSNLQLFGLYQIVKLIISKIKHIICDEYNATNTRGFETDILL